MLTCTQDWCLAWAGHGDHRPGYIGRNWCSRKQTKPSKQSTPKPQTARTRARLVGVVLREVMVVHILPHLTPKCLTYTKLDTNEIVQGKILISN